MNESTFSCPRFDRLRPLLAALLLAGCGGGGGGSSDPDATILGRFDLPGDGLGLLVAFNHAFVATGSEGLQVVDVTDPDALAIVASIDDATADFASGGMVTITDGASEFLIYSAGGEGVHAAEITNPATTMYDTTLATPGTARDVALTPSEVLCIADGNVQVGSGAVEVVTPETTFGVAAIEDYCFATGGTSGGGGGNPELYVIDVSVPASAHLETTLSLPSGTPAGIEIIGDHAYVTAGNPGLFVIDISDPTSPTVAGETDPLSTTGPIAVDATRMRAYLGTTETATFPGGIKIVDITNAGSPAVIGTVDLPDTNGGIDAIDGTAYAVTFDPGGMNPGTLQIVDVSAF